MADTKKVYAPLYVVQRDHMTGTMGQPYAKGFSGTPSAFINIDEHIAAGDILDKETHDKNVAAAKQKAEAEKAKAETDATKKGDDGNAAK